MAEWSKAPDSKSGVRFIRTVGSNPTLSATMLPQATSLGEGLDVDAIRPSTQDPITAFPFCVLKKTRHKAGLNI